VKTELMPDFDFDAFNHDNDAEFEGEANFNPRPQAIVSEIPQTTTVSENVVEPEQDVDPATITEKKPLEARDTHASQGDNLSNEEVDKW
jgi:hypothetical protein